jgi:hypothetical protein
MSFNRTKYDNCSYTTDLKSNVDTLGHILSTYRYEHKDKCMHQLGFVGGTAVSHIQGNLVDLDSELRGQTRILTRCPTNKYIPSDDNLIKNDKTEPINTEMKHLPSCQSIMYRSIPLPPPVKMNYC